VKAVIIAAGKAERWGNHLGVAKHFAPLAGEPIIVRTVRLLRERGVDDIVVVGPDERYDIDGARLFVPTHDYGSFGDADKFLSSRAEWSQGGRTVVLYGDVFFTDHAMDTIVGHGVREWTLFARPYASKVTHKPWPECFAQSFWPEHRDEHERHLLRVASLHAKGRINRCGGWEHYRSMCGATSAHTIRRGELPTDRMVVIDDETDDVDFPADYDLVADALHRFDPPQVLIPYGGDCPHRSAALEWVRLRWSEEFPDWPVHVERIDASNGWRKGVATNNAVDRANPGRLVVCDADVWCDPRAVIEAATSLLDGFRWAIPHDRFCRLTEAATGRLLAGGSADELDESPYRQQPSTACFVTYRSVMREVPIDERFRGWGGEDYAHGYALQALVGAPNRVAGDLVHLWHPPQERVNRRVGSARSEQLRKQYARARRNRGRMKRLLAEARSVHADQARPEGDEGPVAVA
jgi:hypothetical protein